VSPPFQPGQSGNPNGRPTRLRDDQIRWAREVMAKRKEIMRQLEMYPTLEELADELNVSVRYLSEVVNNRARLSVVAA
jgi:hypothetical protein